jgi:hypothetical protein
MRHLMVVFFCVSGLLKVSAQSNAPEKLGVYTNTLGMKFKEMPGTPVLISVWETRVADFDAFLKDTHYAWEFKPHFPQSSLHPVVNTNIQDAIAFCAWLTKKERAMGQLTDIQAYRLPTNREWDAAVGLSAGRSKMDLAVTQKVQDERAFPWGTEWPPPPKAGNFNSCQRIGEAKPHNGSGNFFARKSVLVFHRFGQRWIRLHLALHTSKRNMSERSLNAKTNHACAPCNGHDDLLDLRTST